MDQPRGFTAQYKSMCVQGSNKNFFNTWLNCGAKDHFIWDREVFVTYEGTDSTKVDTCSDDAEILGKGEVSFLLYEHKILLT